MNAILAILWWSLPFLIGFSAFVGIAQTWARTQGIMKRVKKIEATIELINKKMGS